MNSDWQTKPISLTLLQEYAEDQGPFLRGAFDFLREAGVVPKSVQTAQKSIVRYDYDPEAVPAGYLASAAYEWDMWGPSEPEDFIAAMLIELSPTKRDFISSLLTTLGRSFV